MLTNQKIYKYFLCNTIMGIIIIKKYRNERKLIIAFILFIFLFSTAFPVINSSSIDGLYDNTIGEQYHYFNYQEMIDLLHDLESEYPDIVKLENLGYTYEGRSVWMVKLSDNVDEDEDEPGVLLMGAHHGDEKPSFETVIFFIKHMVYNYTKINTDDDGDGQINEDIIDGIDNDEDGLLDEDPSEDRVRDVINNTQIFCIPMVNPDGVEANTRKNRAPNYGPFGQSDEITSYGVDLNRNYGFRWFLPYFFKENYHYDWLTNDYAGCYRGVRPFSEAESSAVKNFVETQDISISLSYHDYGEWMIFPWMHSSRWVFHERLFRSIGENMSRINKYELRIFGQYGTREYLLPRYEGTIGSSENWLYGHRKIIAYTVELCPYRAPTNPNIVYDAIYKHVGVNLYVCERSLTIEEEKLTTFKPNFFNDFY